MHVTYLPDKENWDLFFSNQQGGSAAYFEGELYKRGIQHGSGFFSNLIPYLIPLLKSAAKEVSSEGLKLGSNVLQQLAEGESLKPTIIKEVKNSTKKLSDKVKSKIQGGNGLKRRQSIVGRRLKSVVSLDPFSRNDIFKKNRRKKPIGST
jgi:hypothetical protein